MNQIFLNLCFCLGIFSVILNVECINQSQCIKCPSFDDIHDEYFFDREYIKFMDSHSCHMEIVLSRGEVHTFMVKCENHRIDDEQAEFNIQLCKRTIGEKIYKDVGVFWVEPAVEHIGKTLKHTGCDVYVR